MRSLTALLVIGLLVGGPPTARPESREVWEHIRALSDGNAETREGAALALASLGPEALPAVPRLLDALRDDQVPVYVAASFALERVGEGALPALSEALEGGGTDTRVEVARILARLGARATPAVPGLLRALDSSDPMSREASAAALGEIFDGNRNAAPDLVEETAAGLTASLLRNGPDPAETYARSAAATALGKLGAASAAPALVAHLSDPDPRVRTACAWALGGGFLEPTQTRWMSSRRSRGGLGAAAAVAVPALVAALSDPDHAVRWSAAQALGGLGSAASEAIPALWSVVRPPPPPVLGPESASQPSAAADSGGMVRVGDVLRVPAAPPVAPAPAAPPAPAPAVPASPPRTEGKGVLRIAANVSPAPAPGGTLVVSAAAAAAARNEANLALHASVLRVHAAAALCELGEHEAAAVIVEVLEHDTNAAAREIAAVQLARVGDAAARPALEAALGDSDWQVREAAASALSRLR